MWDSVASDLFSAASAFQSVVWGLTVGSWIGSSAGLMVAAASPYVAWMSVTAGQAELTAAQVRVAAAAYETAYGLTVPPPVIAENRAELMILIATNLLGQNTVTPALKEWSAAVHALLDGRQTVLLRKGGIGEKRFEVAAHEFLLFPTVAHSHAERVRPEHRDLLGPAAADSTDECVLLRAAAKVVAALPVNRPEGLDAIEDLHIWTAESVRADRLDFRPKHKLAVLVVCAIPLGRRRQGRYRLRSWHGGDRRRWG